MQKIVLTGAAGKLGSQLRGPLADMAAQLVSTDILDSAGDLAANESWVTADLADRAAMQDMIDGADMVVHFGAIGDEGTFEQILGPNIIGAYNVWEAARLAGEIRRRGYKAAKLDDAADTVKIAAAGHLDLRDQVDGADAGLFIAILNACILADAACPGQLAIDEGHLAGHEDKIARYREGNVIRRRCRRIGDGDAKLAQAGVYVVCHGVKSFP